MPYEMIGYNDRGGCIYLSLVQTIEHARQVRDKVFDPANFGTGEIIDTEWNQTYDDIDILEIRDEDTLEVIEAHRRKRQIGVYEPCSAVWVENYLPRPRDVLHRPQQTRVARLIDQLVERRVKMALRRG